jgi:hypothetical protein
MTKTLDAAIAALTDLPSEAQDRIGRELLLHVERLHALRGTIDEGLHSLDAGEGESLDVEAFLLSVRYDAA